MERLETAGSGSAEYTAGTLSLQAGVITPGLELGFTRCGSWGVSMLAGDRGRRTKMTGLRTLSCFYPMVCIVRIHLEKEG